MLDCCNIIRAKTISPALWFCQIKQPGLPAINSKAHHAQVVAAWFEVCARACCSCRGLTWAGEGRTKNLSLLPELAPDRYRHSWPEPCLCPVSMAEVGGTDRAMPRTCVHGTPEPFDTVPKSAPPAIIVQSIVVVACPCGCKVCDCRSNNGTSNGCSGPDAECRCLCPSRAEAGYRRGRRMGPVSARRQDGLGAASCCVIDRCGSHTARIDCLSTCCCSIWSSVDELVRPCLPLSAPAH